MVILGPRRQACAALEQGVKDPIEKIIDAFGRAGDALIANTPVDFDGADLPSKEKASKLLEELNDLKLHSVHLKIDFCYRYCSLLRSANTLSQVAFESLAAANVEAYSNFMVDNSQLLLFMQSHADKTDAIGTSHPFFKEQFDASYVYNKVDLVCAAVEKSTVETISALALSAQATVTDNCPSLDIIRDPQVLVQPVLSAQILDNPNHKHIADATSKLIATIESMEKYPVMKATTTALRATVNHGKLAIRTHFALKKLALIKDADGNPGLQNDISDAALIKVAAKGIVLPAKVLKALQTCKKK